ncbi:MAG: TraR/DksA C4-type zinc finger protein [Bryobacterales bacterium]|nr:TraR/DksA C4-type zinc finger protein [Bryobacteraceae bacterium]MDW8355306.1 TraR/DksA C4-type zinc finger protein [Bryobacterales bacterium]
MKRASNQGRGAHQRYREALLAKRAEILENLGTKFDTVARLGRVAEEDQPAISHDEFISLRRNRLDYEQLRMVEEALDRLAAGDYGICLACEQPIPAKRLEVLPWARYCVHCQAQQAQRAADLEAESSRLPTW